MICRVAAVRVKAEKEVEAAEPLGAPVLDMTAARHRWCLEVDELALAALAAPFSEH